MSQHLKKNVKATCLVKLLNVTLLKILNQQNMINKHIDKNVKSSFAKKYRINKKNILTKILNQHIPKMLTQTNINVLEKGPKANKKALFILYMSKGGGEEK